VLRTSARWPACSIFIERPWSFRYIALARWRSKVGRRVQCRWRGAGVVTLMTKRSCRRRSLSVWSRRMWRVVSTWQYHQPYPEHPPHVTEAPLSLKFTHAASEIRRLSFLRKLFWSNDSSSVITTRDTVYEAVSEMQHHATYRSTPTLFLIRIFILESIDTVMFSNASKTWCFKCKRKCKQSFILRLLQYYVKTDGDVLNVNVNVNSHLYCASYNIM